MVSDTVLLTVVLATFALMAGAFYALVAQLGARIDDLRRHMDARFDGVDRRFDGVDRRFDGVDQRLDRLEADFAAMRPGVAVLDERLRRLEGG